MPCSLVEEDSYYNLTWFHHQSHVMSYTLPDNILSTGVLHQLQWHTTARSTSGHKRICWSNHSILHCSNTALSSFGELCFTRLIPERFALQLKCCTGWSTEQVYYITKAHYAMDIWCKHQIILVYKSCTVVKVFWGHNTVLCEEPWKIKSLWIDNLPL